jgi:4-diphosphocytidyl-2C-methyl-D-erythritol kinase
MIIKAFAKINLAIDVKKKDENGYHDIDMVTLPITLHDVLEMEQLISRHGIFITSDDPSLICDEGNLAFKALKAMEDNFSFSKGYRIQIYKRIPMNAGLGGGSADAAGIIRAICKLYNMDAHDPKIIKVARSIGSDVPFCLLNKPARVLGTGENIIPLDSKLDYHVIIVKPHKGLSTKDVYEKYDTIPEEEREHPDISALIEAIKIGDEQKMFENMKNGLYKPASLLCPVISGILNDFKKMGFPLYSMTGSGNACFALSKDLEQIEKAKNYFTSLNYITITASTNLTNQETIYNSSLFSHKGA